MFGVSTFAGNTFAATENKYLYASKGTYSYSGISSTILKSKILSADNGTYSYSGNNVTILNNRMIVSANGTYIYVGTNSTSKLFLGDWEFEFVAVDVWTCQDEGVTAVWTEETTTPITWS